MKEPETVDDPRVDAAVAPIGLVAPIELVVPEVVFEFSAGSAETVAFDADED